MNDSKLVYSTDTGRIKEQKSTQGPISKGDGIIRIRKETKGRKGKGMSIIDGLAMNDAELKALCTQLKKQCGCGGSVKDGKIEIQGDVRDKLKQLLEAKGMQVKLAGG
ncbi:stress response translation initiation inhibitor YciH [Glaciecola sp. MH2013]|uniref:stress response translation initiation inhibitor YciH n=1 Tax=Glaciecola sp. MH2013 TaxID=2785524 RepID=UPI00189F96B0|nr:stress response translation initiation inhibitor YciH [Glaciecola sp. MH2013]MBF7073241.1 stress response translation initiation inhibitor YciH [Glaciecola sp. MH2013]